MNTSFQYGRARFIRWYQSGLVVFLRYLFLVIGLVSVVILLASLVVAMSVGLRAIALFFLSPLLLLESVNLFVSYVADHPEFMLSDGFLTNSFNRLDFISQNVLTAWQQKDLVGLLTAFSKVDETAEILFRLGLPEQAFSSLTGQTLDENALKNVIDQALQKQPAQKIVSVYSFLAAVLALPAVQPILQQQELDAAVIESVLSFYAARHQLAYQTRAFWLNHLSRTGGIGKNWSVSYTNLLDELTSTVPPSVRQHVLALPLVSREKYLPRVALELSKGAGQNLLLVGEPGSGKQELFLHFAKQVMNYETKTALDGKEVRLLDLQRLLAQAGSPAGLQELLDSLFAELTRSNNVILFIDPIAELLSGGSKLGEVDVSNVLQAHLDDTRIHIIGSITPEQYVKIIKPNQLLAERFSVIEIPPPTLADLLPILLSHLNRFEGRYKVFFSVEALDELTKLASRYIKDKASPARELDLLEEIAAANHAAGKVLVAVADVQAAVEKQTQVPLQVGATEQKTLLNLEAELHQRVIGQNRAIKQVSDALLRARAGLSTGARPIGTFLFLGPTGVGKTETAKALAAIYFGSTTKLIRLDMTEYADESGLAKLLGTDQTDLPGSLTVAIQENPSAVVLFDEFEKASLPVKNVLLQLLDEGRLTTNYGKVLDFTNAIIIATSNAGSDYIKEQITAGAPIEQFEKPLIDKLISDRIFAPELLNRFDGVIVYAPLTMNEITQVVGLQVQLLQAQVKKDKGIDLQIAPAVLQQLVVKGYDPVFGARALERVLKNDLETAIAKQIITQAPKPGSTLTITALS